MSECYYSKRQRFLFFTISICVFAILATIVLNVSTPNIQTNCFKSISQIFWKILSSFALIFLILAIWQFNTFCIPAFLSVIFTMVVTLIFIFFIALIFNIYMKLTCVIGIFINFSIHIFIIFCVLFLKFIIFPHLVVFCLWPLYFFCVFLLIFYMFIICFLLILVIII